MDVVGFTYESEDGLRVVGEGIILWRYTHSDENGCRYYRPVGITDDADAATRWVNEGVGSNNIRMVMSQLDFPSQVNGHE